MTDDPTTTVTEAPAEAVPAATTAAAEVEQVTEDLLVEDVSIDGMCGVY